MCSKGAVAGARLGVDPADCRPEVWGRAFVVCRCRVLVVGSVWDERVTVIV